MTETRIVYVVGARPNFVKMAPVLAKLRERMPEARHVLVHTGQHYDRAMSDLFLEELGVPEPDHLLSVGSSSHAVQTARVMERLEGVLEQERPSLILVPGDVNSTLAAALVAAKMRIPLAHVESGLRSFDRSMPEEVNRIVADEFSDLLFVHSDEAIANLSAEGISRDRVHFVGNTMIDSLLAVENRFQVANTAAAYGLTANNYVLVTLHRPALVDGPLLPDVISELSLVAREMPVLFPVHPRTRKMLGATPTPSGLILVDPIGYVDFLSLESGAAGVLTDSGGVQEETTFLGVRCFTLRDNTERPVTIRLGTNTLLGLNPSGIRKILPSLAGEPVRASTPPPLWDGRASERVAQVVESTLSVGALARV